MNYDQLTNLKSTFFHLPKDQIKLLCQKRIFAYVFFSSFATLSDTQLPEIEHLDNKLNEEQITDDQYAHAQKVWEVFVSSTLQDYMELYMKTDIMLIDVFEIFRKTSHRTFGLDPAYSFTLPGYAWQCMLKYTKCNLETLQDVDIRMLVELGIRGGISQCSNRFSGTNNVYMPNYNPQNPQKTIGFVDANNLYGDSMSNPVRYRGFKWADINIDVTTFPDDSPKGYLLDLENPQHLHDLHKDLPFCSERRKTTGSNYPKLMTTLYGKEKYVIHNRNLKQALEHGLILTEIHRVLELKQFAWLKPYIDLNTKLRAQSKNDREKSLQVNE